MHTNLCISAGIDFALALPSLPDTFTVMRLIFGKQQLEPGTVAAVYTGMEYGIRRTCGTSVWLLKVKEEEEAAIGRGDL
ncbi:hypothetical protein SOVF_105500 [Spinacia oleracea]|nr:hypothetical protein SOVF_105500 [Spinacia oleracea]